MARKHPNIGGKREGAGRKHGSTNKFTNSLKEAILNAAALAGRDGKGKGGLEGYLVDLAINEKKVFGGLLARVIPLQVGSDPNDPLVIKIVKYADDQPAE